MPVPLIFEESKPGRKGYTLPDLDVPFQEELIPNRFLRSKPPELPEVSEGMVVRHFVNLSVQNHHVDKGFYPLGSCTMKYNPKVNEKAALFPGFTDLHPLQPSATAQGALRLMRELGRALCEIVGLPAITLQPSAGAHGELTALLMIRAYHTHSGSPRRKVVIPDSAHGTNPASIISAGYETVKVKSDDYGLVDSEALEAALDDEVAAFMITNPNTLGIFECGIENIAKMVHDAGAMLYMDGANMNALMGIARPGDMGFDVVHLNLHKTFSTPHGGGGPGSGPVCVRAELTDFLPAPVVISDKKGYQSATPDKSIGHPGAACGNFGVMVKAYAYIRSLGAEGLKEVSENAVLNANYIKEKLKACYHLPYDRTCMHEVVFSGKKQKIKGVTTLDIAKRLLDYGFHPPTIYFPQVVEEAIMIEPTETESRETLDAFIAAMAEIAREAGESPDLLHTAPHHTPVRRLDEVSAARKPVLRWEMKC
ncbi:MAG: aminomethyl-transferring glycine dehydrogenase subunit GcvPB [candidate division Zixibacteria bacterium]|nr:aminomethyl-transferring glycine dehydrogenase subunit GcvPB [Candidatus Tariuqbacter arcticus]